MMSNGWHAMRTDIQQEVVQRGSFLSKHNIYETSSPANWYRAFIPNEKKRNGPLYFCNNDWTTWTNIKDTLANAGQKNKL